MRAAAAWARAILAHEIAHVVHWDRLHIALLAVAWGHIGFAVFMLGRTFLLASFGAYDPSDVHPLLRVGNIIVIYLLFRAFSRSREHLADYAASMCVGIAQYLSFLSGAAQRAAMQTTSTDAGAARGTYFHPAIDKRASDVGARLTAERFRVSTVALAIASSATLFEFMGEFSLVPAAILICAALLLEVARSGLKSARVFASAENA